MHSLVDFLRTLRHTLSPADLTVLAGLAATGLQYLVSHFKDFARIVNVLLALVFPLLTTVLLALVNTGSPLAKYPMAFVVAKVTYELVEWIKRNAAKPVVENQAF